MLYTVYYIDVCNNVCNNVYILTVRACIWTAGLPCLTRFMTDCIAWCILTTHTHTAINTQHYADLTLQFSEKGSLHACSFVQLTYIITLYFFKGLASVAVDVKGFARIIG